MRTLFRRWISPLATSTTRSFRWKLRDSTAARSGATTLQVELLNADGWDVVHASQCGLSTATDEHLLQYARANNRVVCTLDADLHALLAVSGSLGPSVIRLRREGLRGPDVASLLKRVWSEIAVSIESGAVVTVTERAIRLRRLPVIGDRDEHKA